MQCFEFKQLLKAFLSEELAGKELGQCEKHIVNCEECFDSWLSLQDSIAVLEEPHAKKLAAKIMQATELDPCQACEELLVDCMDGAVVLESEENYSKQLLRSHLSTCEQCENVAQSLNLLQVNLQQIAEITAPPLLLGKILQSTSQQAPNEKARPYRGFRLPGISTIDFQRLLRRPRFAAEMSFAVTVFWMTLFGVPTTLFSQAEAQQFSLIERIQLQERLAGVQSNLNENLEVIPGLVSESFGALSRMTNSVYSSGKDLSQQTGLQTIEYAQALIRDMVSEQEPASNESEE